MRRHSIDRLQLRERRAVCTGGDFGLENNAPALLDALDDGLGVHDFDVAGVVLGIVLDRVIRAVGLDCVGRGTGAALVYSVLELGDVVLLSGTGLLGVLGSPGSVEGAVGPDGRTHGGDDTAEHQGFALHDNISREDFRLRCPRPGSGCTSGTGRMLLTGMPGFLVVWLVFLWQRAAG